MAPQRVPLPWLDADALARLLPLPDAVDVVERALLAGLDPAADPPRSAVPTRHGQLLLMPSEGGGTLGVKVASVAPDNPRRGLPRIQALYLLLDAGTLTPVALLDGTALTSLRTPAVSAVAVRHLTAADAGRLVVFGTGPQAWGHVQALRSVRPLREVHVVGRDPGRAREFADRLVADGVTAAAGEPAAVADADIVVCATTAGTPLFAGELVAATACVVAIGSHQPDRRELPGDLLARAGVVVEDPATALREAGDVVLAVAEHALAAADLLPLADVVTGRAAPDPRRPRVFKGVGMAWQDRVVAAEAYRRAVDGG